MIYFTFIVTPTSTVISSSTATPNNISGFCMYIVIIITFKSIYYFIIAWIYIMIPAGIVGVIVLILVIVLTPLLIYYIHKWCKKRQSIVTNVGSSM